MLLNQQRAEHKLMKDNKYLGQSYNGDLIESVDPALASNVLLQIVVSDMFGKFLRSSDHKSRSSVPLLAGLICSCEMSGVRHDSRQIN